MSFHIVIPARYHSTRLAAKVLADINGKPMLQHVFERAEESGAESVVIATDHERVKQVAEKFGATVCMTQQSHLSGTERIAEVVNLLEYEQDDIIVGLQADEPFIPPKVVTQLAEELEQHDNVKMASVCHLITDVDDLLNPNVTKVVLNRRKFAMYFSRAPIPWNRDEFSRAEKPQKLNGEYYRHVGIYAYRADFLQQYVEMDDCALESVEQLEQLRVLWNCGRIYMSVTKQAVPNGIDTEEDLIRARARSI